MKRHKRPKDWIDERVEAVKATHFMWAKFWKTTQLRNLQTLRQIETYYKEKGATT